MNRLMPAKRRGNVLVGTYRIFKRNGMINNRSFWSFGKVVKKLAVLVYRILPAQYGNDRCTFTPEESFE